jgi:hypothetical protein
MSSDFPQFVVEAAQVAARRELQLKATAEVTTPENEERKKLLTRIAETGSLGQNDFAQLEPRPTVLAIQRQSAARMRVVELRAWIICGVVVILLLLLCSAVFKSLFQEGIDRLFWSAVVGIAGGLIVLFFRPFPMEQREHDRHSLVTILNAEMMVRLELCESTPAGDVGTCTQKAMAWYGKQFADLAKRQKGRAPTETAPPTGPTA